MAAIEFPLDEALLRRLRKRPVLLPALRTAFRALWALVLREAAIRYGGTRLGYLWAFIEPTAYLLIFLSIRALIRDEVPFGESALVFMMSGILTFRAVMSIASRMMAAITQNRTLLTFPDVQPLYTITARAAIESITMGTVVVVFYILVDMFSPAMNLYSLRTFTAAFAAMLVLGWGVGNFNAVVSVLAPVYRTFFRLLTLPLLLASGIFYVPSLLPPEYVVYLQWNPLLHCVEWFRVGIYMDYIPVLDRSYPIVFGGVAFGLSAILSRVFRVRITE